MGWLDALPPRWCAAHRQDRTAPSSLYCQWAGVFRFRSRADGGQVARRLYPYGAQAARPGRGRSGAMCHSSRLEHPGIPLPLSRRAALRVQQGRFVGGRNDANQAIDADAECVGHRAQFDFYQKLAGFELVATPGSRAVAMGLIHRQASYAL